MASRSPKDLISHPWVVNQDGYPAREDRRVPPKSGFTAGWWQKLVNGKEQWCFETASMTQRTGVKQSLPGVVYVHVVYSHPKNQRSSTLGQARSAPYPGKENGPKTLGISFHRTSTCRQRDVKYLLGWVLSPSPTAFESTPPHCKEGNQCNSRSISSNPVSFSDAKTSDLVPVIGAFGWVNQLKK